MQRSSLVVLARAVPAVPLAIAIAPSSEHAWLMAAVGLVTIAAIGCVLIIRTRAQPPPRRAPRRRSRRDR